MQKQGTSKTAQCPNYREYRNSIIGYLYHDDPLIPVGAMTARSAAMNALTLAASEVKKKLQQAGNDLLAPEVLANQALPVIQEVSQPFPLPKIDEMASAWLGASSGIYEVIVNAPEGQILLYYTPSEVISAPLGGGQGKAALAILVVRPGNHPREIAWIRVTPCNCNVLGYLYYGCPFASVTSPVLKDLTTKLAELKRSHWVNIFQNMFAEGDDSLLETGLTGYYSLNDIQEAASVWCGREGVKNNTQIDIVTDQGIVQLKYRVPVEKARAQITGTKTANLEILVKRAGAEKWRTVVNFHMNLRQ